MKERKIDYHGAIIRVRFPKETSDREVIQLLDRFQNYQISNMKKACAIFYSSKEHRYRFVCGGEKEMDKNREWGECVMHTRSWV